MSYYTLWKKTITYVYGDPADESERTESETEYCLVSEEKADEFGDLMADDYGSQDYSYQVNYTKQLELEQTEWEKVLNELTSLFVVEKL